MNWKKFILSNKKVLAPIFIIWFIILIFGILFMVGIPRVCTRKVGEITGKVGEIATCYPWEDSLTNFLVIWIFLLIVTLLLLKKYKKT